MRKVLLAEVENRELQHGVEGFAGGFDGRDVAVFERRENGADGEVERGQERQAEGANQQAEGIEPADGRDVYKRQM